MQILDVTYLDVRSLKVISLTDFARGVGLDWTVMYRLLILEESTVYRVQHRSGFRHYILLDEAVRLHEKYPTPVARRDQRLYRNRSKLPPLETTCPTCGKTDRQHRHGRNRHGSPRAECAHCGRNYTLTRPLPLKSTCPFCSQTSRQYRSGRTRTKRLRVTCGHCGKYYALDHEPASPELAIPIFMPRRPKLTSICPYCGATSGQHRRGRLETGRLRVICSRCSRGYSLDRDPACPDSDPATTPPQSHPSGYNGAAKKPE